MMYVILIVVGLAAGDYCPARLVVGGRVTGLVNGLLGISGPLSSDVFLTLELAPVSYFASEATTAAESVVR